MSRLTKTFFLTWFSFALFYVSVMPFTLERSARDLLGPALLPACLSPPSPRCWSGGDCVGATNRPSRSGT